jgi:hypothetical protein
MIFADFGGIAEFCIKRPSEFVQLILEKKEGLVRGLFLPTATDGHPDGIEAADEDDKGDDEQRFHHGYCILPRFLAEAKSDFAFAFRMNCFARKSDAVR